MRIEVVSGVWMVILAVGVFVVIHKKHQDVRLRNPALGKPPRGLPQGSHAARKIEFTPLLIHHPTTTCSYDNSVSGTWPIFICQQSAK